MRDKASDILLMIGITLSFFLVLNGNCMLQVDTPVTQDSEELLQHIMNMEIIFRKYSKIFFIISFICAECNCFAIYYLWMKRRTREMAIRYIFGYNIFQLIHCLLRQLLPLLGIVIITLLILQSIVLKTKIFAYDHIPLPLLSHSLLICLGTLVIMFLWMLAFILWMRPSELLRKNKA